MPTYDYRCTKCKHLFELFHSITDDTTKRCPRCKAKAVRVPAGGAGLLFKGSGFYITDYRSKAYNKEKAKQEGSSSTKPGGEKKGESGGSAKTSGGDASGGEKKSGSGGSGNTGGGGASGGSGGGSKSE
jgi:putative FmdB family regulatory protein